jgi:hypothetical protein
MAANPTWERTLRAMLQRKAEPQPHPAMAMPTGKSRQ